MEFESKASKALRSIVSTTFIMILVGIAYALFSGGFQIRGVINGVAIGGSIGILSSAAEVFIFSPFRQRLTFGVLLVVRTFFYLLIASGATFYVVARHASIVYSATLAETLAAPQFKEFLYGGEFLHIVIYALVMSFAVNFVRQVNRLLGHNALLDFITGKYHQPIAEERIFMFLDLKSSTTIAEKLGDMKYHRFLNDFFHDISPAIHESKGSIYQYVGDEVVVTWTKEKGLKDANCINCYFRVVAAIQLNADQYERKYGVVPEFKAGYHFGPVISGEMGDLKKEIVFHGDTVNTAARIRTECTSFKKDLLLSADLLQRLPTEDYLSPESIGRIRLRGKEEEIELFTIREAA